MISPLASVHPNAKIGDNVTIDPFAYIEEDVVIGDGCHIYPHAAVLNGVRMGKNCNVHYSAVIGNIPQDLKFHGEYTTVEIGDNNNFREFCTVHRGTFSKEKTVIGSNNLIMSYCHVAHDCVLHDHIIMSNCVQLAGEVEVDDWAIIGGGALVHQFTHIGAHCMVQGGSKVTKDVPPYIMAGREPLIYCGLNAVGLKRRDFSSEVMNNIQGIYRYIYMSGKNVSDAVACVKEDFPESPEREAILSFIEKSSRGIIRGVM